jgi:phage shock protein PspC (stress-responsive transcriptional regulator)
MESTTTPPPGPEDGPTAPRSASGGPYGPYPGATPPPQRQGADGFFDAIRRTGVVRTDNRWVGGVAGGIAQRFGLDPLLVRGILAASTLISGLGLVVYGLGWALLPEARDGRIHLQETLRGRFDIALLGAVAVFLMGLNRGSGIFWWFGWDGGLGWLNLILWLAAIGVIVAMGVAAAGQRHEPRVPPAAKASYPPSPPAATAYYPPTPATGYGPYNASTTGATPRMSSPAAPVPPGKPVPPPWSVPPKRPIVHGSGPVLTGIVLALSLLSLAALLLADRVGSFTGPVVLTATGITIVLAGIGIMLSGLRGRRSGSLGAVAVLAILLAVPLSWGHADGVPWDWNSTWVVGDKTYRPTTPGEAAGGYSVLAGNVRVDLTGLPYDSTDPVTVPVSVGAGNVTVIIPNGVPTRAVTRNMAGQVNWNVDGSNSGYHSSSGVDQSRTWQNAEANAGETVKLNLDVKVNAGQITIQEEG